jgi:hypothetical protein
MPNWTDAQFYAALSGSPLLAAAHVIRHGNAYFEDPAGSAINTKFDIAFFVITSQPLMETHAPEILAAFAASRDATVPEHSAIRSARPKRR